MLEGLDAVFWSELTHAYGPATDVPNMLRKLTSPDPALWVGAIDQLYGTIFHQQTLYNSTAPAVPFLIELLDCPQVRCRGKIMQLLADLAEVPPWLEEGAKELPAGVELDEEYLTILRDTYQAAWSGWKTYLLAGSDVDPRLRVSAPKLLAELSAAPREDIAPTLATEMQREVPATLQRWFEEEPNAIVQASVLMALGKWARRAPDCLPFIHRQLIESRPALTPVRLAAAMALAEHPVPPREVLDVFASVLADPEGCKHIFSDARPSVEDRHDPLRRAMKQYIEGAEAVAALDRAGDDRGADEDFRFPWIVWETLGAVMRQMSLLSVADTQSLAGPLVAFVTKPDTSRVVGNRVLLRKAVFHDVDLARTAPTGLTAAQRDILTLLFDDPECWANISENIKDEFKELGVPYDREELARLLGRSAQVTTIEEAERHLLRLLRTEAQGQKGAPRRGEAPTPDHFRFLKRLMLWQLGSDAFLHVLHQVPELEELHIGRYTTDRGLAQIRELPGLRRIWLNENITDRGFAELSRFPTLNEIGAYGTRITDASAAVIAKLPNLAVLGLAGTPLSDAGLRRIAAAKLPLEKLHLQQTAITDASVGSLASLPRLWVLDVDGTGLTAAGIAELRTALPRCRISAGNGPGR